MRIKALEGSSLEELEAYHQRTHNRILPNLDQNIKNGNSLVDVSYAQFDRSIYSNISLMNKIKMFDWNAEFGNRKFDAIIGNPPYIRVQNMVHYSPEEYAFYKSNTSQYSTAVADTLDKYYLFIEKGLSLLNGNGMLGYIVPHKFMKIKSGAELRELLATDRNVQKILHFGTHQVFRDRSTYTCILVLSKQPNTQFEIGFVQDWNQFLFEHNTECLPYPAEYISKQPWSFLPQNIITHLERISTSCVSLSTLVDIFVGVQTSADKIYIVHADREDDSFIYSHDKQNREFRIEKEILRKSIYDTRLSSYEKIVANSYIIFPYKDDSGKPVLYTLEEMNERFPCALAYSTDLFGMKDIGTGRIEFNEGVVYEMSDDKFIFNLMNFPKHNCFEMTNIFDILHKNYKLVEGVGKDGGYHAQVFMSRMFSQMEQLSPTELAE